MSIATGLIAKLLLAISVIPAAGYGGYCVYDHCYPTFHNQLIGQGWTFSPIDGDMGSSEDFSKNRGEITQSLGGDWRCTKQLFTEITPPALGNGKSTEEGGSIPSTPSVSDSSNEDSVGCLVADLGYVKDTNKKGGFLKWELALRSENKGFVYVGYFSVGESKYITSTGGNEREDSEKVTSFSTVFEVSKESGTWNIKNGLNWADYFTTTGSSVPFSSVNDFKNVGINVSLAEKHNWNSSGKICSLDKSNNNSCGDASEWEFKRYVGFWEQSNNENGKQVTDAIKISAIENKSSAETEHLHDIWSQTNFDFSTSTQTYSDATAWSSSVDRVYDTKEKKWKSIVSSAPTKDMNAKDYLKAIYSPWAKKKGTWMDAEGVCYESNKRNLNKDSEEAKRLLKFCYKGGKK